eukprot:GSMAST32.ASY1.ANO1.685.1 assembled CDS
MSKELRRLAREPPPGVKYLPEYKDSGDNIAEVFAELNGPSGTPFEGGTFVVKLLIGPDYPSTPPKGHFLTKIYHPNVSLQGEICVNTLKKDWKADLGLCHVLKVIWCLLVVPFPESSLNDEAGKLFMESYGDYAKKARLLTDIHAKKTSNNSVSSSSNESSTFLSSTSTTTSIVTKSKPSTTKSSTGSAPSSPSLKSVSTSTASPIGDKKKKKKKSDKSKDRKVLERKKSLKRL